MLRIPAGEMWNVMRYKEVAELVIISFEILKQYFNFRTVHSHILHV
jgi:hypothetical protein